MGQLERVEEEARSRKIKSKNGNGTKVASGYVSYNPTKEEKQAIREMEETLEDIADYISTYLQDGFVLTWKYMPEQECYSVVLRENLEDWRRAKALSCWHADWTKCWRMMYHALHNRYNDWPNGTTGNLGPDIDW